MEIPNVGVFRIRNQIVAVSFNDFLMRDAKSATNFNVPLEKWKLKGEMNLTRKNINNFVQLKDLEHALKDKSPEMLEIDNHTKTFLRNNFNIELYDFPKTTK